MKKIKTKFFCCTISILGMMQLNAQNNTVAAGGDASGSGGSASYSIGQIDYINSTSGTGTITQGNQQPYEIEVLTGIAETGITVDAAVYPNPTADYVTLKVELSKFQNLSYQLFDMQGKQLKNEKVVNDETIISLKEYAYSGYFIKIINNQNEVKTIKIIKN